MLMLFFFFKHRMVLNLVVNLHQASLGTCVQQTDVNEIVKKMFLYRAAVSL